MCDITDDVKIKIKEFRFKKYDSNAALIRKYQPNPGNPLDSCHKFPLIPIVISVKVDREKQIICLDEEIEVSSQTLTDQLTIILADQRERTHSNMPVALRCSRNCLANRCQRRE